MSLGSSSEEDEDTNDELQYEDAHDADDEISGPPSPGERAKESNDDSLHDAFLTKKRKRHIATMKAIMGEEEMKRYAQSFDKGALYQLILRLWDSQDQAVNEAKLVNHLQALNPSSLSDREARFVIGWFLYSRDGENVSSIGQQMGLTEETKSFAVNFPEINESANFQDVLPGIIENGKMTLGLMACDNPSL